MESVAAADVAAYYEFLMSSRRLDGVQPNVVCIGAARSGTTYLMGVLSQSEDCYVPPVKEVNFFGVFQRPFHPRGLTEIDYERLFVLGKGRSVIADVSPAYLAIGRAAKEIFKYRSDMRIVICVRDPVERFWSHFKYYRREGMVAEASFEVFAKEALEQYRAGFDPGTDWAAPVMLLRQSFYSWQINLCRALFGKVLVLFAEDLAADEAGWRNTLGSFLGVELQPAPENYRNSSTTEPLDVAPGLLEDLRALFSDDIVYVQGLTQRQLADIWPSAR